MIHPAVDARLLHVAGILIPLGGVALALITQHVFDMQPCPWCVLQRLIFIAIAIVAALGLAAHTLRQSSLARAAAALMGLLALGGVAAALWQHFVAAASVSCNLTLADRIIGGLGVDALLPQVFAAYATSCAEAAAKLFGVPYEFYSLTLFVVLAAIAFLALRRPR